MFKGNFCFEWLPDGRNMKLLNDLTYITKDGLKIIVPSGEVTDGASIPRCLWRLASGPFEGKYRNAAVIHDYLYRNGYSGHPIKIDNTVISREKADRIFYEAMLECGVGKIEAWTKYKAVRLFGPRW